MIHSLKHHLKHKACALALSAATILTTWYVLGYFLAILGQKAGAVGEAINKILQYAPQLALMLQFVSPQAWPINGFEIKGFLLGFFQIFITAKIIFWAIAALYERIHRK